MGNQLIVQYPDPRLREHCKPVTRFDSSLGNLIDDLASTLYSTTGIGLSAPQIGQLQQLFVMDLSDNQSDLQVYINPVITQKAGLAIVEEACLSLPGVAANVMRASTVSVQAKDRHGNIRETKLSGMHAVCIQHETDHLHGKLFIDRISAIRRLRLRKTLKSLESNTDVPLNSSTYTQF